MALDVIDRLRDHASRRGGETAIEVIGPAADAHPPLTRAALLEQTQRVAAALDGRLPLGAAVMLLSRNRPAVAPAFLGVVASGRTVFPVDPTLTPSELQLLIDRAAVAAVISESAASPRLSPIDVPVLELHPLVDGPQQSHPLDRTDGRLLLQSSGTTGLPKIVRRSAASLDAVARNVAAAVGLRPYDRVAAAVPLSHSYGIENGMLAPLLAGATTLHHVVGGDVPGRGLDPAVILDGRATVLPGVPSLFEMIDRLGLGRGDLRLAYSAGATLPNALADRLQQRWGLRLGSLYGSTEIGSVTFGLQPGTVGQPMQGVDLRVLPPHLAPPDDAAPLPPGHEGHVAVRAPSMFDGYLDERATRSALRDGFFLTGDLGRRLPDGSLQITGRLKLLIDVGGIKINPIEVEQAVASHPAIAECVILPDPASDTINRLRAVVTRTDPDRDLDVEGLRRWLRQRLAPAKVPRYFEVRDTLPKSPTGKVLRQQLEA